MKNNSNSIFLGTSSDIRNHHMYMSNSRSKARRFSYNIKSIYNHIKQLNSDINTKSPKSLIVFDYYLIINECTSMESYLKIIQKQLIRLLAKYHKFENVPKSSQVPIMKYMLKSSFDANDIHLHAFLVQSHLYDGVNIKKAIMNGIGKNNLNYKTRKQLNKINNLNQLYKLTINHKQGVIKVASSNDIKNIINQLVIKLHHLQHHLTIN